MVLCVPFRQYPALAEKQPLTLQGAEYAQDVQELKAALERAEDLLQ